MNIFGKKEEKPVETAPEAAETTPAPAPEQAPEITPAEVPEADEEKMTAETAVEAGARLQEMAEKFEIPESFEGHEILSISDFKVVGGKTYAIAYCENRCTYDVPLIPKA